MKKKPKKQNTIIPIENPKTSVSKKRLPKQSYASHWITYSKYHS